MSFSIVCVYNNEEILNNYLIKSLRRQTAKFELIALNNTQGRFKSAAEALNYGGRKAKGEYIMFVHQDVDLCFSMWLEEAKKYLDQLPNLGVAGVAGRSRDAKGVITNIKHGFPPRPAGEIKIQEPVKVQTVDDCLVIIPNSVFNILKFDEDTCNKWDLYVTDYCLNVQRFGFNVYVIPMYIHHGSPGYRFLSKPEEYYSILAKLSIKHRRCYRQIYTTMGIWDTSFLSVLTYKIQGYRVGYYLKILAKRGLGTFIKRLTHIF
jgi:hypothetical protein